MRGVELFSRFPSKKAWSITETRYPKRAFHLPTILSQEEVPRLIQAVGTSFRRTLLMTLYATGARNTELTHLKVSDIDSVIHIQGGSAHFFLQARPIKR